MLKKKYLIIFSLLLFSSLISFAWFSSIDSNNNNYIQIGNIRKYTTVGLDGMIFKYENSEKRNLPLDEWFNRASFTSLGKLINLKQHYHSVHIRKLLYFDKLGFSADYILALHTKDMESKGTFFNITQLDLDISTDNKIYSYHYSNLYSFIMDFEYSTTSKTIKETNEPKVSCAVIDLSNILQKHIKSKKLWVVVRTNQGNITFKIRG